jgi:GTPase
MASDSIAPIFLVSSVDGRGLDHLRLFLNLLPQRHAWGEKEDEPVEFVIDEVFSVPGVGTVVAGTLLAGVLTETTPRLLVGPDPGDSGFKPAALKSIHYKRVPATRVVAGQAAALALKKIKRSAVRKGMALVSAALQPQARWEMCAEIAILTHSSTIACRYQAVVHVGVVRQTACIVAMSVEVLRSGDRARVRFRFMQRPEYVRPGDRFIFREGRTKGIGVVLPYDANDPAPPPPPTTTTTNAAAAAAAPDATSA